MKNQGASAFALIREGVEYSNGVWKDIIIQDLGYEYQIPEWILPPKGVNAKIAAHMRPVITLVVWETVPVIIKTTIDVGKYLNHKNHNNHKNHKKRKESVQSRIWKSNL